jgi:Uma2 family endonuclease
MTVTLAKCTIAQYHQMIAAGVLDEVCVELLNGEIVDRPPEGIEHAVRCSRAAKVLRRSLGNQVEVREGHPRHTR